MELSRSENWSGWPFSYPGNLPDPGIKPGSPAFQADSLPTELSGKPVSISKPLWPSKPNALRALFLVQDLQTGESVMGFRPLTPLGEPLQL